MLIFAAGTIRRFNNGSWKANQRVPDPPADQDTSSLTARHKALDALRSRAISAAFRGYAILSRNRGIILPWALMASGMIDRCIDSRSAGALLLSFPSRLARNQTTLAALPVLSLIKFALVAAATIHLAASKKPSAARAARLLNLIFRRDIRLRNGLAAGSYFATLLRCEAYERILREAPREEPVNSLAINYVIGAAHLNARHGHVARYFLERAGPANKALIARKLGCTYLLDGDTQSAAKNFKKSVELAPRSAMAHQNYAAKYDDSHYVPSQWETDHAGELLIYDNWIQMGESFYHQGRFTDAFYCYQKAFNHQDLLAAQWSVPTELIERIAAQSSHFKPSLPIRLLGYDWVTLIGHIGFLDCYVRMAKLGMIPQANYVLFAPPEKVANPAFLALWDKHFCVVRDPALINDLFPYQRLVGDQFIGFRSDQEIAEPWAHAASRAQVAWQQAGKGTLVALPGPILERGRAGLAAFGMPDGQWFVCLHVREGGFHGDGAGSTRQHRSSAISDYFSALERIVSRGGWVVRMGDRSMTRLPRMDRVIDYAHHPLKSPEMDLFLLAECRFFIGTTSGLTSAVQALGTPMLLLNCTSADCQFWTENTDFIVKPVYDRRARRYLSLRETYRQPVQSYLIDGAVLAKHGYEIHPNTAEEIAAATEYKLDCLLGVQHRPSESEPLMQAYRRSLADNCFNFGAAVPARPFLTSRPELIDG